MVIEQTVEIPESRRISLDLPAESPVGRAKITVTFESDQTVPDRYAALENLRGIAKRMGSYKCSLADAVGVATALELSGQFVSADHHELEAVAQQEPVQFLWLPAHPKK